jgi:hypothetical protein
MSNLNPEQFNVDEGRSPLEYPSARGTVQRLVIRHPNVNEGKKYKDTYIDETRRKIRTGKNGRLLKTPREEVTPGAGENAAGFIDYEDRGEDLKIHYMKTATHLENSGVAQRGLEELIKRKNPKSLNFGKLMSPAAGRVMAKIQNNHPDITVQGTPWYNS